MKTNRKTSRQPASAEEHKLCRNFETLRDMLGEDRFADRLDKPLAYWALESDRRLPLALLGWPVRDIVALSFEKVLATPGVGEKKLRSLVDLLKRATADEPPGAPLGNNTPARRRGENEIEGEFKATQVSEAMWAEWCEAVRRHNLLHEPLGRLAPTLEALPTVIWDTPLSYYVDRSIADIRQLKTHGAKRLRAILEVFFVAYRGVGAADVQETVDARLVPKFVEPLQNWIVEALAASDVPSVEEMHKALAVPIIDQIQTDLGKPIADLVTRRLGINGPAISVRRQAKEAGLTRARIYQLFEECAAAMQVRWPEGRYLFMALGQKLAREAAGGDSQRFFTLISDLFYPRASTDAALIEPVELESPEHEEEPVLVG